MRPILVHGGGKAITQAMNESGLEPQWAGTPLRGRTDAGNYRTHPGSYNQHAHLQHDPLAGLSGQGAVRNSCVILPTASSENGDGRKIDLGLVGKMTDINAELLICSVSRR